MNAAQSRFKVEPEVVGAALSFYKLKKATISETKEAIDKFLKRIVI